MPVSIDTMVLRQEELAQTLRTFLETHPSTIADFCNFSRLSRNTVTKALRSGDVSSRSRDRILAAIRDYPGNVSDIKERQSKENEGKSPAKSNVALVFVESAKSNPKVSSSKFLASSVSLKEAIQKVLAETGQNRLPEGLEALHEIPLTLARIARSIDDHDWNALIDYIRQLEADNKRLIAELSKATKRGILKIWIEESAKSWGGWQAWTALSAGAIFVATQFGPEPEAVVNECLENLTPPIVEDFWPLVEA